MNPVIIVMGVAGTGKSTIGKMLSDKLEIPFYDADDFHPATNKAKMRSGQPLNDEDRAPWLEALAEELQKWQEKSGAILACSALKRQYRATLSNQGKLTLKWIFLRGDFDTIYDRMKARKGHFMPKELLQSQFDTLEVPETAITLDIRHTPEKMIQMALDRINSD